MRHHLSRRAFLKLAGCAPLCLPAVASAAPAVVKRTAARLWTVKGHDVPALSAFDTTVRKFMQDRTISGGSLAVTRNSKLVFARGYTWSDQPNDLIVQPTSLFRIASITKPFTAVAVLKLAQEQQLDLGERVTNLLNLVPPAGQTADSRLTQVTVKRLLQHLGGWNRDTTFDPMFYDKPIATSLQASLPITRRQITTYMTGRPLQHDPGSTYVYSNYGYSLLGQIIENVTGKPYYSYIAETILTPLGISRMALGHSLLQQRQANEVRYYSQGSGATVFDNTGTVVPSPYGAWNLENMDSHGGLIASAVDVVRFATAFDTTTSTPILSQSSVEQMFGLPENIASSSYKPGDFYYGCGWAVRDWRNGYRNTWHDGSLPGTSTLLVRRGDHLNWCVLFNQRDDPSKLSYSDIDGLLHQAANSVTTWPTDDLFPEYLTQSSVYLPSITGGA